MSDYYADKVLATSPYAFYRLNETAGSVAVDSTGSYNGTYIGPTLNNDSGPDGHICPTFDGINDWVNISSANASFDPDEGTMAVWGKVTDSAVWTDSTNRTILQFRVDVNNYIQIRKSDVNNTIHFTWRANGVSRQNAIGSQTSTDWMYLSITWSVVANEIKFFIDGAQVGSTWTVPAGWSGTPDIGLGSNPAPQAYWNGSVALGALWDTPLDTDTIISLADPSEPIPIPTPYVYEHMPANLYDILVYNHSGELQLILDNWSRLDITQRTNAPWSHQITMEYGYDDPNLETIRNILPDWMIEVYRIDPVTLVRTKIYEGFNTTIVDQVRISGGIILNLYGAGYTQLLQRRITIPPSGSDHSTKTGLAEAVIKEFVGDSMVSPADSNRKFSGVTIAADSGAGNSITYSTRYVNLLSVCETVSEQGSLDFGVYGGSNVGDFIFDARNIWGDDLREGNLKGNIPVIFSVDRDNMLTPILASNYSAEQNYAYVGGEGEGADRIIEEVEDVAATSLSPWARKEVWVESRQQADTSALVAAGNLELYKRRAQQRLSFNVKQTDSSRWIRDWNLGDLITAKYYQYSFDKQITQIKVAVTSGQSAQNYETITVEMEDVRT